MTEKPKPIESTLLVLLVAVPILAVGVFAQRGISNPIMSRFSKDRQ